jgi:two-component system cell cycle sensor histidine kinase/response regulator CckA
LERPRVLLIEDEPAHAELALRGLARSTAELDLSLVETLAQARGWLASHRADVVLSDLNLSDGTALELLAEGVPLVIMTSQGDERRAVAAMKGGALDYVVKSPDMFRDLAVTIQRALRIEHTERERRRAEVSLRESEERFRQLAESIEEAFWLYDLGSRAMVYASPAWSRVYGTPLDQALSPTQPRFQGIHDDDRARISAAFDERAPREAMRQEYRLVAPQGTRWIEERTFPILDAAGQPWRIAGIGSDITHARELELALLQSQKMEAVGQLAGGIAHDFNNMLTAIMAAAEQLRTTKDGSEQQDLCELIVLAAERTSSLTNKLLAFSRKGKVSNARVDMHSLVTDTASMLTRSIDPRIKVRTELAASMHTVSGDAGQLQNAVLNLGINARDAMPEGGELHISTSLCSLDEPACAGLPFELKPGQYLEIAVRDTGTGIAPEHLSRVFEPFFTTKPIGQGTGLGLAAVYGTAVEHAGAVTASSELGRGTVFRLLLPLSDGGALPVPSNADAPKGHGLILLVDDEPMILNVGAKLLRRLGYEVVTARDGAEGVRLFAECRDRLAAVLCDIAMPELSGREAERRMRELDPTVPIILSSGFPRADGVGELAPTGGEFLAKPFRLNELAHTLSRIIGRRAPRQ